MRPLIRPARHGDGADLARIDFATWSPLHAVTERPKAPADPFFDGHRDPREHLVAEEDGELLGYAVVRCPVPLPAFAHVRQIQSNLCPSSRPFPPRLRRPGALADALPRRMEGWP
ncbi:hypothetical protein ABZ630_27720, partial [Streptomyces albidoflavus]|uniref:GNAT family N-acetyltransferase n=1 Tax=Streptomyces albidoflavus TaxID=1886 RepID=UPI003484B54F